MIQPGSDNQSAGIAPGMFARHWLLLVLAPGSLALTLVLAAPIPQDPAYHAFADTRTLLDVANLMNVLSNLPFLLVGGYGLWIARRRGEGPAWLTLFAGVALVAAGSAWYHAAPDSKNLVWDRLPMTIGFMGLFTALLAEYVHRALRHLLVPAVVIGVGSVIWWAVSDDLRVYAWVQFMPLLALPVLVWRYGARYTHQHLLFAGLGAYLAAKVAEHFDLWIYTITAETVSGHTLKHLVAAVGVFLIAEMIRLRTPLPSESPAHSAAF